MTAVRGAAAPPNDVVEAFGTSLIAVGRPLLQLPQVLSSWDAADAGWAGTSESRMRLADALNRLEAVGTVELPSRHGAMWDRALPWLPTRIGVPCNRTQSMRGLDAATVPWVPALSWAGSWIRTARPQQRLRLALVAVNRWLASTMGSEPEPICREERSLEVFDDEKALCALEGSALFDKGRLTLELLRCQAPLGGVRIARFTDKGPVLIVENKATFDSAWRALRQRVGAAKHPGYAAVLFGSGDEAVSLVRDLKELDALIGVHASYVEYAGDVDIAGVSAAAAFIRAALSAGLDGRVALPLWDVLAKGNPAGTDLTGGKSECRAALDAASQLGLPDSVAARLREGVRVPQERLSRTRLSDTSWWVPSV